METELRAEIARLTSQLGLLEDRRAVAVAQRDQERAEVERLTSALAKSEAGHAACARYNEILCERAVAAEQKLAAMETDLKSAKEALYWQSQGEE